MISRADIIMIGPMGTGKSTVSTLIAAHRGVPVHSMDVLRWDYFKEIAYDEKAADRMRDADPILGLFRYRRPFAIHSIDRILADFHDCVFDLGAGDSVYEDEGQLVRVTKAFLPFPNVVLLLPAHDREESVRIIGERLRLKYPDLPAAVIEANAHFIRLDSNQRLAKIVVYTKGKTPEDTCSEVLNKLNLK